MTQRKTLIKNNKLIQCFFHDGTKSQLFDHQNGQKWRAKWLKTTQEWPLRKEVIKSTFRLLQRLLSNSSVKEKVEG